MPEKIFGSLRSAENSQKNFGRHGCQNYRPTLGPEQERILRFLCHF